jgi:hypothetical protein
LQEFVFVRWQAIGAEADAVFSVFSV